MFRITDNAVYYTVNQLFRIACGGLDPESIHYSGNSDNSEVTVEVNGINRILFKLISDIETEKLLRGELHLDSIPSFDSTIRIPVALADPDRGFACIKDNSLIINADIITISFLMLSRYEEKLISERDNHNRFQYKNSLAHRYGFIDFPIVDEYAMILRTWLKKFLPGLVIPGRTGRIIPTHDIDFLMRFGNLFKNFRTIAGGDIIARKSISMAAVSIGECLRTYKDRRNDPLIRALRMLIDVSLEHNLKSAFYFKGLRKGEKDCSYDIYLPEVRYCMDLIMERGMEVGFHAGYDACTNETAFRKQKEAVEEVSGLAVTRSRQHFLRFDVNQTPGIWEESGIKNDSTLGYAEREGFRCGTSHEYSLYDIERDRVSNVTETPLIIMESTLFVYRMLTMEAALENIKKLYLRTRAVEGDFVILWHNHSVYREYDDRFRNVYCRFLEEIS